MRFTQYVDVCKVETERKPGPKMKWYDKREEREKEKNQSEKVRMTLPIFHVQHRN